MDLNPSAENSLYPSEIRCPKSLEHVRKIVAISVIHYAKKSTKYPEETN